MTSDLWVSSDGGTLPLMLPRSALTTERCYHLAVARLLDERMLGEEDGDGRHDEGLGDLAVLDRLEKHLAERWAEWWAERQVAA